ncbi:MAG TPA: hypothetical protein VF268_01675, partial [Gammaproteobacteria bacterium]
AGQYSGKLRIPILAYAIVEAIIGILALIFHNSFVAITDGVYLSLLPGIDSALLAHLIKWTIAAMMIVPQSILLGMTFPLMTAGVIRRYPTNSGSSISLLYFTNSIGAAFGVLASGFWLIKHVGLPGTIMTAGLINILLALAVWIVIRIDPAPVTEPLADKPQTPNHSNRLLLLAAFITGMASFIYEIGWIRMLSLVLGSSTHAFELMLSAFIAGLAFGGLWIRKRIDIIQSPIRFAAYIQIIMGILALLTLPVYGMTFDWMSSLMKTVSRTDEGYRLLLLASHGIVFAVMLPATFCAGMTLPLFTHALLKTGYGEKSIGRIYAFNTAGAIMGVLFAVNIGLPYLGLKYLIGFGAALDIVLGIGLLAFAVSAGVVFRKQLLATSALSVIICVATLAFTSLAPSQLASGVFRYAQTHLPESKRIYFYRDGKTASISLYGKKDEELTVATNGKPDASIHYGSDGLHTSDEGTMMLAAALPFGFKPDAKVVANIGMGSGLTTHTLLALPQITRVDTIEIESAMVAASREFGDKVRRAHSDPRSKIHIEDAKTFFSVNRSRYDIIVSEPSNPWVSGTSSLFTEEFYRRIGNYLVDDGIFVQWLHLYESNIQLIASVLKALGNHFSDYAIYAYDFDFFIVARKTGNLGPIDADSIMSSALKDELVKVDVRAPDDLRYRFVASKRILEGFLRQPTIPANSDYFPYLDLNSHKAFFFERIVEEFKINHSPLPLLEMLAPESFNDSRELSAADYFLLDDWNAMAEISLAVLLQDNIDDAGKLSLEVKNRLSALITASSHCDRENYASLWLANWHAVGQILIANLSRHSAIMLWDTPAVRRCMAKASPDITRWMTFYQAVAERSPARMGALAEKLLQEQTGINKNLKTYLLTSAVLGRYLSGNTGTSLELWRKHGPQIFSSLQDAPFYLQVLVHMVADNASKTAVSPTP